jgi:hypothetical protein
MMTIPDINALTVVVRTLREDWADQRAVRDQITQLAENYDQPDIAYAAVVIARDLQNRSPVTLSIKAPDIIARLHTRPSSGPRTPGPSTLEDNWRCDVCGLRVDQCQASAGNRGDDWHEFMSVADAEAQRDAEWTQQGKVRRAAVAGVLAGLFTMPDDI